jgi:pyrimidine operon attenuation protein/uracil phosphoribosyltransferase
MRVLLDAETAVRGIRRMAGEIVERAGGAADLALVGIRRGGVPLAATLARHIEELERVRVPVGAVDIALYRDDASTALPKPQIGRSEIPFEVTSHRIVLVDDVLYTGRTVRAALDALLDYGRPRKIELAVLVDRGGRELPIAPDFVVKVADIVDADRIDVVSDASGYVAYVYPGSAS